MAADAPALSCDVAVIGGGISGMIAALRAAQGGRSVLVLEKSADDRYVCNTRLSAGVWHCCNMDLTSDPKILEAKIMEVSGGNARPDLAHAISHDGVRAVRWMQSAGIRFIRGPEAHQTFVLSPPTVTVQGRQWEGRGGDVMLRTFEAELNKVNGKVLRGHGAARLKTRDGKVVGVYGATANGQAFEIDAASVVIADGGFQSNPDETRGRVTLHPEKLFQRNARTGMGDGMRMAQEAGAALSDLRGFYGHVLSRDAFTNDKLWPYVWLDYLMSSGIIVTRDGRRFYDEGLGAIFMANAIAALPDPLATTVIADEKIWTERGAFRSLAPNPRLVDAGGTVFKAPTLDALAQMAGLDAAGLQAQVAAYNEAVRADRTVGLTPTRSTAKFKPYPIVEPPFYAFPACAGITYTMGGIAIDGACRALGPEGAPIAGLYAVGCATGGLEGGATTGYVGGLVKSSVTGLRAAEHILGVLAN